MYLTAKGQNLLPPWQKEVMFLVALVCLSVTEQHYSNSYERIAMKFYGGIQGGKTPYTTPGELSKKSMLLDRDFLKSSPGLCMENSGNETVT